MLDQEILTATITGRRDVLRNQLVSEVEIILEMIPRQIHAVKSVGYSAKLRPIPRFLMKVVPILASCDLL